MSAMSAFMEYNVGLCGEPKRFALPRELVKWE